MWGRPGRPFLSAMPKCDTILTGLCACTHQILYSHTNMYFVHACLLTDHNYAKIVNHISMGIVTLPLNVSLDLGSVRGAQYDLAMIDTDRLLVTCYSGSQGPMTLGREKSRLVEEFTSRRKGSRALRSRER